MDTRSALVQGVGRNPKPKTLWGTVTMGVILGGFGVSAQPLFDRTHCAGRKKRRVP